MKLFVGLGNPGAKYAQHRHNIGFRALDRIAEDHGATPWRAKFQGLISEVVLAGEKTLLLKPETFMNNSGQSVAAALKFYKLDLGDVVIFHDELDLAPGKLRVKTGGGLAGHNGLKSINAHLGDGFQRVRIGIGHPGRKDLVSGYVLRDFAKADSDWVENVLQGMSDGAEALANGDAGKFQNAVALRTAPPRSSTTKPKPTGQAPEKTTKVAPKPEPDRRSALQKLIDKFS